ncbi:MAG: carboxypeptidase-like regulatory domain-containing protein [Acidobacteria bacterium]|nr:carboxypeptidase-like regulatory domain-containing protein [Acidobacteriota bacterium]MCA1637416.1 carboxypeptidase-like regulatory domain-containing protein [Acidobacteriota bacterium]
MKTHLLWLLILISVVFTNVSFACSRFEFGVPICAQFTRADAVFIGKAIKIEDLTGKDDYPDNWLKVQFKVQQNFKGAKNSIFTLITNDWRAACGLKIKKGQTWIIYANYDDEDNTFVSNIGYKYNPKEDKEDLEILNAASERKTNTTISGRLISHGAYEYKYEPVEITVEGNGSRQTTTTNVEGTFKVSPLTAGNYKVKMKFPFHASPNFVIPNLKYVYTEGTPTFFEYEAELKLGDCDYSFFEIFRYSK